MNNILEIQNLTTHFKNFPLKNVSFSVPEGFIMGFIGPNGAGKTTTIKSILGMLTCDSGAIKVFGLDSKTNASQIKEHIGVVMDQTFFLDDWTPKDVESAISPFYTNWDKDLYSKLVKNFDLSEKKKIKDFSRGMKMKLMVAAALSHNARLLILDEPTSGLDPVARDELMDILSEFITDEKRGILFSTHITSDLEKIADYITFIKKGNIVFTGTKEDLLASYAVVKGGPSDITSEQKKLIIGYREHPTGFEGLTETKNLKGFSKNVLIEPSNLDEIIIYINKGELLT